MRWAVPLIDDHAPHQIRILTDSWQLYVSCICRVRRHQRPLAKLDGIDPRVIYQRHLKEVQSGDNG